MSHSEPTRETSPPQQMLKEIESGKGEWGSVPQCVRETLAALLASGNSLDTTNDNNNNNNNAFTSTSTNTNMTQKLLPFRQRKAKTNVMATLAAAYAAQHPPAIFVPNLQSIVTDLDERILRQQQKQVISNGVESSISPHAVYSSSNVNNNNNNNNNSNNNNKLTGRRGYKNMDDITEDVNESDFTEEEELENEEEEEEEEREDKNKLQEPLLLSDKRVFFGHVVQNNTSESLRKSRETLQPPASLQLPNNFTSSSIPRQRNGSNNTSNTLRRQHPSHLHDNIHNTNNNSKSTIRPISLDGPTVKRIECVRHRRDVTSLLLQTHNIIDRLQAEAEASLIEGIYNAMRVDPRRAKDIYGEVRPLLHPTRGQEEALAAFAEGISVLQEATRELVSAFLTQEEKRFIGINTHKYQTREQRENTYQYITGSKTRGGKSEEALLANVVSAGKNKNMNNYDTVSSNNNNNNNNKNRNENYYNEGKNNRHVTLPSSEPPVPITNTATNSINIHDNKYIFPPDSSFNTVGKMTNTNAMAAPSGNPSIKKIPMFEQQEQKQKQKPLQLQRKQPPPQQKQKQPPPSTQQQQQSKVAAAAPTPQKQLRRKFAEFLLDSSVSSIQDVGAGRVTLGGLPQLDRIAENTADLGGSATAITLMAPEGVETNAPNTLRQQLSRSTLSGSLTLSDGTPEKERKKVTQAQPVEVKPKPTSTSTNINTGNKKLDIRRFLIDSDSDSVMTA